MKPFADARLRLCVRLLPVCFVGHALQLTGEDVPWSGIAMRRYWTTPGWHLYLPPAAPAALAVVLAIAVIALAVRPSRATFYALAGVYTLHYLTYPWRIRNHMTTMLAGLVVVSLVWLVGRRAPRRLVDRMAATGLAAVLCTTYFFAGLHKTNRGFVDPALTPVTEGLRTFFLYGHLGSSAPRWAIIGAAWSTIVIECFAPLVAWRVRRLSFVALTTLMLFHLPQVTSMDVADYPMIASASYAALLSPGQMRVLSRHLGASRWTVCGAALGAATQLWFMPYASRLIVFGIVVLALWGWAMGAMARATWAGRRRSA